MDNPAYLTYTKVMQSRDPAEEIDLLRRMVIRLSRLVEISVTLNSTLDLNRLLQFIIDSAADLVESEAASILLVDEKTQDLYFAAATGSDPQELKHIPVPMEGSLAGTILREERPLIINEVSGDPRHFRHVGDSMHFEVRSLVGVPLRIRDKVTGVLEAINKREGQFDEADLDTLSNIASQAAVAINNARLVDALQRAYDELGNLDRLKSDFIAIASHELRTPLSLVMGYAALLKDQGDADTSEHAKAVLNSALRMRRLVEAMTNMDMLQMESAELVLERTALQPILQSAYDEVVHLIQTKGQQLSITMPEKLLEVHADRVKLRLALVNILNNAMRFTPAEGHIWLSVERRGREAWIVVRDDGVGIEPDKLERIFTGFYQADDHMRRRHEGLGLGLAIVKAVVDGHQGRVWAESAGSNKGSRFTIALPLVG